MKPSKDLLCAARRLETLFPLAMSELFRSEEADPLHGLPIGQIRMIRALLPREKSGAELCVELRLSPSSLAQMARRMIRAGLIEKRTSAADKRIRRYALTELGRTQMEIRRDLRAGRAARALQKIPSRQVDALIELLESVVDPAKSAPSADAVV